MTAFHKEVCLVVDEAFLKLETIVRLGSLANAWNQTKKLYVRVGSNLVARIY